MINGSSCFHQRQPVGSANACGHQLCLKNRALINPLYHKPALQAKVITRAGGGGLFSGFSNLIDGVLGTNKQDQEKGVEFPPYAVIRGTQFYDLRLYNVYPVVEIDYTRREEGYLALGGYIDGDNQTGTAFNYTQPVVMRYEPEGRKSMQMFVGSKRGEPMLRGFKRPNIKLTELPSPTSPGVRLNVAGGELVAVLRFEGSITPQRARAVYEQLVKSLKKDGVELADSEKDGLFRIAQYGPVYTIEKRMAEILLAVKQEL